MLPVNKSLEDADDLMIGMTGDGKRKEEVRQGTAP